MAIGTHQIDRYADKLSITAREPDQALAKRHLAGMARRISNKLADVVLAMKLQVDAFGNNIPAGKWHEVIVASGNHLDRDFGHEYCIGQNDGGIEKIVSSQ